MNAVAQAYDYTSKIQEGRNLERENTDLALQSRMDELTGILNRRGFIEQGQAALDLLQETDTSGVIFFADMDGLKKSTIPMVTKWETRQLCCRPACLKTFSVLRM